MTLFITALILLFAAISGPALARGAELAEPIVKLDAATPAAVGDFTTPNIERLARACKAVEQWAAEASLSGALPRDAAAADAALQRVDRLTDAKRQVDINLYRLLNLRHALVAQPPGEARRQSLRRFLEGASALIDLSGRMRYLLNDGVGRASFQISPHPEKFQALLDLLIAKRSNIGGSAMAPLLIDPPAESRQPPASMEVKRKVLRLVLASRQAGRLPILAEFVKQKSTPDDLVVTAAEIMVRLGLWQDPRPGQDEDVPKPPITVSELHEVVAKTDASKLSDAVRKMRSQLLVRLSRRAEEGFFEPSFRAEGFDLREGDWLLMRNPSPYNMFTDLSPGLFTHVGVVTTEIGEDGKRRFVIVEMPERKARIPATNVNAYLNRTLHYVFVRHEDEGVGRKMGEVARRVIGAETHFDLTFRTERVQALKGQPLEDTVINTYCAGFLLLCAQETPLPRESFFPVAERPAAGKCLENLAKLGLSIGDNFVSPTSALFSPQMEIVATRLPMYEPSREIKEDIYDYFARSMIEKDLTPSPDARQLLRQKLAALSKNNPLLARLLASANDVSEHMDLESAAKAAAVVETLDEVADSSAAEFLEAREAFFAGPVEQLKSRGMKEEKIAEIEAMRQRHQPLFQRWTSRRLSPRDMQHALIDYYIDRGRGRIDARFFPEAESAIGQ